MSLGGTLDGIMSLQKKNNQKVINKKIFLGADPEKWLPSDAQSRLENISKLLLIFLLSSTSFYSKMF